MIHSKGLALLVTSVSLSSALSARADGGGESFGQDGQLIVSAERLFGLSFSNVKTEPGGGGGTTTDSRTTVSLLWPEGGGPYQVPRAAVDVVVASGVTLGGSIGFITSSGTTKVEAPNGGASTKQDSPSTTVFALSPRVGYALALTDRIAFWPRAGITYFSIKSEFTTAGTPSVTATSTLHGVGLDVEPLFAFSPASHFAITAGPILDFPLSGSESTVISPNPTGASVPDDKVKHMNYGLAVGVLGYF
jgi:hypothetical protein